MKLGICTQNATNEEIELIAGKLVKFGYAVRKAIRKIDGKNVKYLEFWIEDSKEEKH